MTNDCRVKDTAVFSTGPCPTITQKIQNNQIGALGLFSFDVLLARICAYYEETTYTTAGITQNATGQMKFKPNAHKPTSVRGERTASEIKIKNAAICPKD